MIPYWLKFFLVLPGNPQFSASARPSVGALSLLIILVLMTAFCVSKLISRGRLRVVWSSRIQEIRGISLARLSSLGRPKEYSAATGCGATSLLSFLPCFQGPVKKIAEEGEPIVVAAHNDFVLCSGTRWFQQDYYICYRYTKQCDALPPPPQRTVQVIVGLMCNVCVWDYVKNNQAAAGKYYWSLTVRVNLEPMVMLNPLSIEWNLDRRFHNVVRVLALNPNHGDILYLELCQHIVMLDGVAGTLTAAWKTKVSYDTWDEGGTVFPFMLPGWPTPNPGHNQREQASSNNSRPPH